MGWDGMAQMAHRWRGESAVRESERPSLVRVSRGRALSSPSDFHLASSGSGSGLALAQAHYG